MNFNWLINRLNDIINGRLKINQINQNGGDLITLINEKLSFTDYYELFPEVIGLEPALCFDFDNRLQVGNYKSVFRTFTDLFYNKSINLYDDYVHQSEIRINNRRINYYNIVLMYLCETGYYSHFAVEAIRIYADVITNIDEMSEQILEYKKKMEYFGLRDLLRNVDIQLYPEDNAIVKKKTRLEEYLEEKYKTLYDEIIVCGDKFEKK